MVSKLQYLSTTKEDEDYIHKKSSSFKKLNSFSIGRKKRRLKLKCESIFENNSEIIPDSNDNEHKIMKSNYLKVQYNTKFVGYFSNTKCICFFN